MCLLLFFVAACSSSPSANTLRISITAHPTSLDPTKCYDFTSSTLVCLLHEGLTRCLPGDQVEPAIALKIDVSPDGTVYTFHLREARWNDGRLVTATDFERSWKQALNPKSPSVCAYLFYPILHAEAAAKGTRSLDEVGLRAVDAQTFEVRLERPTAHFLSLTAFPSFLPVSETGATNGPFCLERVVANAEIVLKKSSSFWNRKQVRLDGIHISIIPDENAAWKMFERGELDWLGGALSPLPWEAVETLAASKMLTFDPMGATTFCVFNAEDKVFQNEKLRQAFSMAMNREQIGEQILHGTQLVAKGCVPPSLWDGNVPETLLPFDAAEARRLFAEGCQELGTVPAELGPIHLSLRTNYVDRLLAQILQWQWRAVLGVEVVVQQSDTKTLKDHLHRRKYQVAVTNWISQYHDPLNILERFMTRTNAKNYAGWENGEFVSLMSQGKLRQAEAVLAKSCPIAPIYHWQHLSVCAQRVKNMHTTANGGVLFERCWLEKR